MSPVKRVVRWLLLALACMVVVAVEQVAFAAMDPGPVSEVISLVGIAAWLAALVCVAIAAVIGVRALWRWTRTP